MKIRLQKFLAEAAVASRRASEELITSGHVRVNGQVVRELGVRVNPATDEVRCDGRLLKPRRKYYIALHKPRGVVSTRNDPRNRKTVIDLLPREWSMVYPVGRLDADSEGLLLLTNDGDFCLRVTHPRYEVPKRYVATVEGRVGEAVARRFVHGVVHDGERLRAQQVRVLDSNQKHSLLELELTEGRNREVRRLFESQGLTVVRLCRIRIGPVRLGELPAGRWRTLSPAEIRGLMHSGHAGPPESSRAKPCPEGNKPTVPGREPLARHGSASLSSRAQREDAQPSNGGHAS